MELVADVRSHERRVLILRRTLDILDFAVGLSSVGLAIRSINPAVFADLIEFPRIQSFAEERVRNFAVSDH